MATKIIKIAYQLRRSTEQEWLSTNPVLRLGEPGFVTDKNKIKIGDGVTSWNDLEYLSGEVTVTPDGDSVVINSDGSLTIYGYSDASAGQIPVKGSDGKLKWSNICLRRDNHFNYKSDFVPQYGEVCLVDTAKDGLRVVCGDGVTTFNNLEYFDDFIIRGYFKDNKMYKDLKYTQILTGVVQKLYIDLDSYQLYVFDGTDYIEIKVVTANEEVSGTMKLYSSVGQNTDGTMTQKAITDELNKKFEMDVSPEQELIVFTKGIS